MNRRFGALLALILLGTTACGDATITASARFPRDGDAASRGTTVRVEAEHSTRSQSDPLIE